MARVRIGPLSYGPKGRRGVHVGPFSASYNVRNPFFGAFMLLVVVVAIVQSAPYLLLLVLIPLYLGLKRKEKREQQGAAARQLHAEQAAAAQKLREQQAVAEAKIQAEAQRKWLEGPPPTLYPPHRFSEKWFAGNLPKLHPGQVRPLFLELYARGWTNERIEQRLHRYFQQNPFLINVTAEELMKGDCSVGTQQSASPGHL